MAIEHQEFSADVIKEIGFYTQKVLVTLNAGGIVALLTFIANLDGNDTVSFEIVWLKRSVVGFLAGLSFVGLSLFLTYLEAQRDIYNPERQRGRFYCFMIKMAGPPLCSFVLFVASILLALNGIAAP